MRANTARETMEAGGKVVNGWCNLPCALNAEILARAGFDAVSIDLQHGMVDFQTAVGMLQAISQTDATPMCRVPWNEPSIIMKMLDAGAYGIICPMINSAAEAEAFVQAANYPQRGIRSYGPLRANLYGGADYAANANATISTFAMIETQEAFDNRKEIIATPDLTGIYVGPSDLSLSMGRVPHMDREEPEMLANIFTIRDEAKAAGKLIAIHVGSAEYGRRMLEEGFDMVSYSGDATLLSNAAKAGLKVIRGE